MTDQTNRQARKDQYYLNIAEAVADKSTCIRRAYGAVLVKDDEIVATGYNGSPRGCINCTETGCIREQLGILKGDNYNLCTSVHAEMNAIISAARAEMLDGTLYIVGLNRIPANIEKSLYADPTPCLLCHRQIINAGIKRVVVRVSAEDGAHESSIDREIDMSGTRFMERLNELYERTLNEMEEKVVARINVGKAQQRAGLDTVDVRKSLADAESTRKNIFNAREVLKNRQEMIAAAMDSHAEWTERAQAFNEVMRIMHKYNIPIQPDPDAPWTVQSLPRWLAAFSSTSPEQTCENIPQVEEGDPECKEDAASLN